ncbi:MAG: hypothetical protein ACK5QX_09705 [bacterium]
MAPSITVTLTAVVDGGGGGVGAGVGSDTGEGLSLPPQAARTVVHSASATRRPVIGGWVMASSICKLMRGPLARARRQDQIADPMQCAPPSSEGCGEGVDVEFWTLGSTAVESSRWSFVSLGWMRDEELPSLWWQVRLAAIAASAGGAKSTNAKPSQCAQW